MRLRKIPILILLCLLIITSCRKAKKTTINDIVGTYVGTIHSRQQDLYYTVDTTYLHDTVFVTKGSGDSVYFQGKPGHTMFSWWYYKYNDSNTYFLAVGGTTTVYTRFYPGNDSMYNDCEYFSGYSSSGYQKNSQTFTGRKIK